MRARLRLALLGAGMLALLAPVAGVAPAQSGDAVEAARARAWVVRVTSSTGEPVVLAESVSEGGETPAATAVAGALGGESPSRATADASSPDSVATPMASGDPTGSGTVEGLYAEAHVAGASAVARSGAGSLTGSGFAMANELFTWEQQETLMGQWSSTNSSVFGPLNEGAAALEPALGPMGWRPPRFQPMAGLGWIDVINAAEVASSTEASSTAYFSSARAEARAAEVLLFGGFIEVRGVVSRALSESTGGQEDRSADASIASLRVAGVPVTLDAGGLTVAGNDITASLGLRQNLDAALAQLAAAGVTIRMGEEHAEGDLREATGLQVEIAGPDGATLVSVGYASASAATVGVFGFDPDPPAAPPTTAPPVPSPAGGGTVEGAGGARTVPAVLGGSVEETPDGSALGPPAGPEGTLHRVLPVSAARSLRTAYLLLAVAGLLAALALPLLMTPAAVRTAAAARRSHNLSSMRRESTGRESR